jgi:HTH-type transcriptional regulator/antitoxin HigA
MAGELQEEGAMAVLNPVRGFEPNWSTHPGEHLEEYLEVNGWSQADFARRAGLTPKLVSDIINQKNPVSPETALKLERVLGVSAEIWTRLQASWDLFMARQKDRSAAPERRSWLAQFPVKELQERRVLPKTRDESLLVDALLKFLGIGRPEAFMAKLNGLAVNHRQSKAYESSREHVFAWLMLGEHKARSMDLPPFDGAKFRTAIAIIRGLTREPPRVFEPRMKALCRDAGVALIFEKPIAKTRLFGSARWVDEQHALIQMSLRMKSNDHFWWTFFHECGHIVLHRGQNFADDQNAVGEGQDAEADAWAESFLYGEDVLAAILATPPKSEDGVRRWAEKLKLHPGIVVGMLQHHGVIPHGHLNRLKDRFEWAGNQ